MKTDFESLKKKTKETLIQIIRDLAGKNGMVLSDPPAAAMLAWESVIKYLLENPSGGTYLQVLALVQRKKNPDIPLAKGIPYVQILGLCDDVTQVPQRLTRMKAGFGIVGLDGVLRIKNYKHDADHLKFAVDVRNYLNGFYELYYGPCRPETEEVGS